MNRCLKDLRRSRSALPLPLLLLKLLLLLGVLLLLVDTVPSSGVLCESPHVVVFPLAAEVAAVPAKGRPILSGDANLRGRVGRVGAGAGVVDAAERGDMGSRMTSIAALSS